MPRAYTNELNPKERPTCYVKLNMSINIIKKDDKDQIKFSIYISCYNFQWMKYKNFQNEEESKFYMLTVCLLW